MLLRFEQLDSTNTYVREHLEELVQYAVVMADFQTAGRGQRGNSWESERGCNLLMSMLFLPGREIPPVRQFVISKLAALAMRKVVAALPGMESAPRVSVKWPNDIYIGDRKVAGILIEHPLSSDGRIAASVIGIGVNVNQRSFRSDAPNPVALIEYTGREIPPRDLALRFREEFVRLYERWKGDTGEVAPGAVTDDLWLDRLYMDALWRNNGFHLYRSAVAGAAPAPTALRRVGGEDLPGDDCFEGEIKEVAPDGAITLRLRDNSLRSFHFKELIPVI